MCSRVLVSIPGVALALPLSRTAVRRRSLRFFAFSLRPSQGAAGALADLLKTEIQRHLAQLKKPQPPPE